MGIVRLNNSPTADERHANGYNWPRSLLFTQSLARKEARVSESPISGTPSKLSDSSIYPDTFILSAGTKRCHGQSDTGGEPKL